METASRRLPAITTVTTRQGGREAPPPSNLNGVRVESPGPPLTSSRRFLDDDSEPSGHLLVNAVCIAPQALTDPAVHAPPASFMAAALPSTRTTNTALAVFCTVETHRGSAYIF
jgi:hypothetical protein